jgi:hypothetical protein
MHRVSVIYTKYFNRKYKTVGHTFQGSFNSKAIDDLDYYHKAINYIRDNPVEGKLLKNSSMSYEYTYSNETRIAYYYIFFEQKFNGEGTQDL